jgi:hypothetical protein
VTPAVGPAPEREQDRRADERNRDQQPEGFHQVLST